MRYHQERCAAVVEVFFEPFGHFGVEVVGRLVEDEHIRMLNEYVGEGNAFFLTARQCPDYLVEVVDVELAEYLAHLRFIIPRARSVHRGLCGGNAVVVARSYGILVFCGYAGEFVIDGEQLLTHREAIVKHGVLLQIAYCEVVAEYDTPRIGVCLSPDDVEQRALACAVFGDEGGLLVFHNGETDALKEHLVPKSFGEILHLQVCNHFVDVMFGGI